MADLKTFVRRIKLRARKIEKNTDTMVRKVILAVDQAVVLATPVDTGRARANWQPTLGDPATGTLPEPKSSGAGLQMALEAANRIAAMYKGGQGSVVHITNNLEYIEYLNQGSSTQAPANYVGTAILVAVSVVQGVRITDITS